MDYPSKKSGWRYFGTFIATLVSFAPLLVCDLFDVPSNVFPGLQEHSIGEEVRVSLSSLILLLLAVLLAAYLVTRNALSERDNYFRIVEDHYGIKTAIHRLRELQREGQKIWDNAPQYWNRFDSQESLARVQEWEAALNAWRNRTEHEIKTRLCEDEAARFMAIDTAPDMDVSAKDASPDAEMSRLRPKLKQHLGHLEAIISEHDPSH